jgi:hypothetical protein
MNGQEACGIFPDLEILLSKDKLALADNLVKQTKGLYHATLKTRHVISSFYFIEEFYAQRQ